jgi:hypothetical protein
MAGKAEFGAINSAQAKLALQKTWSFFPMSAMSRGHGDASDYVISSVFLCGPCLRGGFSAAAIDPPFAKLIPRSWFAKVVVMSERSPDQLNDQIRELLDPLYRVDSGRLAMRLEELK